LPLRERASLFFAGSADYHDDFHRERPLLKRAANLLLLGGWPVLVVALLLWRRTARPVSPQFQTWAFRAAALAAIMGLVAWPTFWIATGFF
jgi:hypothetical protein